MEVIKSGWGHESGVLTMGLMPDEKRLPWWSVVNNLPCNAGYTGLICGRGTKIPHAVEQPSLHVTTTEPTHWSLCATTRAYTLAPKMLHDTTKTQRAETKTQCSQINVKKKKPDSWLALPATWGHSDNLPSTNQDEGSPGTQPAGPLSWAPPTSRNQREIYVSCLYYSATSV